MNIVKAIKHIRPSSQWVCNGSYETLVWLDVNTDPKPSLNELELAWSQISKSVLWEATRAKRDAILLQSDWTQLPDSIVDKTAWANYRTELRNIPQNFATPEDVIWPSRP